MAAATTAHPSARQHVNFYVALQKHFYQHYLISNISLLRSSDTLYYLFFYWHVAPLELREILILSPKYKYKIFELIILTLWSKKNIIILLPYNDRMQFEKSSSLGATSQ